MCEKTQKEIDYEEGQKDGSQCNTMGAAFRHDVLVGLHSEAYERGFQHGYENQPAERDDDEQEADSSDDDDDSSSDYSSTDYSSTDYVPSTPSYVPPHEDPPAVITEREFSASATIDDLNQARERAISKGTLTAGEINKLYLPNAERVETRRLDNLIERINGRSEAQLHEEFLEEVRVRATSRPGAPYEYSNLDIFVLGTVASLINAVAKWDEMTLRVFQSWNEEQPFCTILARRRLQAIDEEKAWAALKLIEPLEQAEPEALSRFLFGHYRQEAAVDAVARITRTQRHALVLFIQNYRDWPIGIAAKKRYVELLDEEYAQMVGWDKFLYWLFRRDRDRDV